MFSQSVNSMEHLMNAWIVGVLGTKDSVPLASAMIVMEYLLLTRLSVKTVVDHGMNHRTAEMDQIAIIVANSLIRTVSDHSE